MDDVDAVMETMREQNKDILDNFEKYLAESGTIRELIIRLQFL